MKKPLSERVIQSQSEKKARRISAKIEFIALQEDIKEALDKGCSMKAVWETLSDEGHISFGYKAFRHYVLKLIKSAQENTKDEKQGKSKTTHEIKGFTFNPIPNPKELL
ncbi:TPA: TraK family protein [Legionella pneumophila]|uniref:TraK family protein n=1 Tax=Legionella sp. PC997 TaxID=2755562 RepID=UPI0005B4DAE3|nr:MULTISPECIES: TraK family protein [Legionella]QMT59221.1 Protein TraK [Legionella sp. PC997]HAT1864832.1 TraK family protein [Legionella pneumophila]HAT1875112.1 TraK family protein [Legionella pneumophila]HAT1972269.1 TraK family protein [Legionella pneumophila]HAT2145017.1 TraK family protein [Legionella pneumophila]